VWGVNGTKRFYVSKTFWFNLLALVVGVSAVFGFSEYVPDAETQQQINAVAAFVAAGVPVVNLVLRFVTSSKITL
jgi:hypothetical protein